MKRSTKIVLGIVGIAIVLVTAALIIIGSDKGNVDPAREHSIVYFESHDDANTYLFYDSTKLDGYIGGSIESYLNCDGSVTKMRAST